MADAPEHPALIPTVSIHDYRPDDAALRRALGLTAAKEAKDGRRDPAPAPAGRPAPEPGRRHP